MQAVVVEGYTDVMACHLAGVGTAVATCGTAFGDDHIKILRRLLMDQNEFRGEVVFTFDGDSAGQKAALKAFQDDQKFVTQTFVAVEPSGMDPCELRQHKGDPAVRDLVARRVPLFEFAIRSRVDGFDLDTNEGRTQATRAGMEVVRQIRDVSLRISYARSLACWVGLADPDELVRAARGGVADVGRRPAEQRQRSARARTRATRRCGSSGTRSRWCCRRRRWPPGSTSWTHRCSRHRRTPVCSPPWSPREAPRPPATAARSGSRRSRAPQRTRPSAGSRASSRSSRCPPTTRR